MTRTKLSRKRVCTISRKSRPIGKIKGAWLANTRPPNIPYVKQPSGSPSRAGQLYEEKFLDYLQAKLPFWQVYAEPWIKYADDRDEGWCAPDALTMHGNIIVIWECKLKYRPWGVRAKQKRLYRPCVEMIWPGAEVRSVQVCRHLNPKIKSVSLIKSLDEAWKPVVKWKYKVLTWRSDY